MSRLGGLRTGPRDSNAKPLSYDHLSLMGGPGLTYSTLPWEVPLVGSFVTWYLGPHQTTARPMSARGSFGSDWRQCGATTLGRVIGRALASTLLGYHGGMRRMATCVRRCLVGKAVQPLQSVTPIRIAASSVMDMLSNGLMVSFVFSKNPGLVGQPG